MKKFTVYTYLWPAEEGRKASMYVYTRWQGGDGKSRLKTYEIEAVSGYEAKKIATKMRWAEENQRAESQGEKEKGK